MCPGSGGWSAPRPKDAYKKKLPLIQLFDLTADPGEKNNVYAQNPTVVKSLYALLAKHVADGRSTPGAPQKNEGVTKYDPKGFDKMKKELGL